MLGCTFDEAAGVVEGEALVDEELVELFECVVLGECVDGDGEMVGAVAPCGEPCGVFTFLLKCLVGFVGDIPGTTGVGEA